MNCQNKHLPCMLPVPTTYATAGISLGLMMDEFNVISNNLQCTCIKPRKKVSDWKSTC